MGVIMAEDLVGKVISFLSGDSDNLSDKDMLLRQRHKELGENKYAKFFRAKNDEADPSLAVFFYSLYKMILPIRTFMKDLGKMTRLRQIVLEAFMDNTVPETVKRLNPTAIEERAKTTPPEELTAQIRADIAKLSAGFDSARMSGANRCYNLVMVLFQLVNFNYPALLKKFDANFTEGLLGSEPKFSAVKVMLIAKELGEFLAVSQGVNPEGDWKTLLQLLKICAGEDLISLEQFAQILKGLRDIIHSKILEQLVQYGLKNPIWECKPKIPDEHIAEAWLEVRTAKAQECIAKINNSQRNTLISALVKEIFEDADLERLEYYTVAKGEVFQKRNLEDFVYAEGLNYLQVFLDDYLEKGIHERCDILLIRGQWTNNAASKEMSEALHQLLELSSLISQLDESLSDDGSDGSRLKASLLRVDRDHTQARYINSIIESVNDNALELLNNAAQHFTVIGKHLKSLIEDVQKKHPEMIINWRELNMVSKDPLAQSISDDCKKLNYFVQLMRLCTQ